MKKIKVLLLAVGLFFMANAAQAQSTYKSALGMRFGLDYGLTYKNFITNQAAVEGLLVMRRNGFRATGLYEWHEQAFDLKGLKWHYGAGPHLWMYNDGSEISNNFEQNTTLILLGIDAIGGLEYTFEHLPINMALNWKPGINLVPGVWFFGDELTFSIRYAFKGKR